MDKIFTFHSTPIVEVIKKATQAMRKAKDRIDALGKELRRLKRKETKVPRKLKKKLKKMHGQEKYLKRKQLGCFTKPYIPFSKWTNYPLIHFGGGRRSYLHELLKSDKPILIPEGGDWKIHPFKCTPKIWKFEEFPNQLIEYFKSMIAFDPALEKKYIEHIRDTGMPTSIIDWLHHKWIDSHFVRRNVGRYPDAPFIREEWWTVGEPGKGLSTDHLLIDDTNTKEYEQAEQNNSSSTFRSGDQGEDPEAVDC